jgi:hypothetical protein
MASRDDVVTKRFVFSDCKTRPLTYLGIVRAAGFAKDLIRGRMVVNIELFPKIGRTAVRRAPKRSRSRRTRGR